MTPFFWLRWLRRLVVAAVAVVVVVFAVTAARIWYAGRQDHRPRSDVIIVLGASQFNGRPSEIFAARLDHAAALYAEHVAPTVMTIGGRRPGDRYSEAQAGAAYLGRHAVPSSALVPVGAGNNTIESLRAAEQVMRQHGWHSAVLVTDPWHSLRAQSMAHDVGMRAVTSPVRTGPVVRSRSTEVRYVARETVAYLYYKVLGGSAAGGPPAA